jgi:hypothetical protein
MESHARAHEMFAEDGGTKAKGKPKVLSQKAAKAAYRKGTLNLVDTLFLALVCKEPET